MNDLKSRDNYLKQGGENEVREAQIIEDLQLYKKP